MNPTHFDYEEQDGVGIVRLNRPDRLNALTFDSYAELRDAFVTLGERDSVRSILLTGTGRAFCSGGDVKDIIGHLFGVPDEALYRFTRMTCDLIENMRRVEKPIVAALNGTTCGAGAVMAAAADIRIAADSAKIAFLFTQVGLCGADMGAGWLLPRIVGLGHASELLMMGDFISAARAYEIGLYNKVVPAADLAAEGFAWAQKLAKGPTMGLAVTKRMLNDEASMTLSEAMQAEGWIQAECMKHPDYKEAFDAFIEKRPKNFSAKVSDRLSQHAD
ncbi:MAG TPA: enoyl-CoA hydratase family protein [Planctomycetota bacterium]|nr:enoyl-CoA hydratase family protein [Planctomycetota bacterium]